MAIKASVAVDYFRTVLEEGKKVVWPTREIILRHTAMVVVVMIISAAVFAGVDYVFQQLVLLSISK